MTEAHEHEKHESTIIVNTKSIEWTKKEITFDEVVTLSNLPKGPDTVFTVTYRKGEDKKREGNMVEGETVHVKDGMVFNVSQTNKS